MGEVYRARDSALGRDVALKVLHAAVAQEADSLARFQREAQVLASLNHPHIATIYGLEDHAIVMELVEGPTLADRLAQGLLPLEEAVTIARQIAEALEYAHERGIIHRDLKPANVKITAEGAVKVLDFGLAKLTEAVPPLHPESSPTLTIRSTRLGTIIGSAAYMAPEQARGLTVDRRADIWAYGVVLYEMITARRAFPGDSFSDVVATVLKLEPDWNAVPANVPEALTRLIRRCLDKDRKHRLRDMGEARIALEDLSATPAKPRVEAPSGRRFSWITAAALVTGVAMGAGAYWLWNRAQSGRPIDANLVFRQLTRDPGLTTEPAISPDGKFVIYASDRSGNGDLDLWLQQVQAGGLPVRLTHDPADEHEPAFSPDGNTIAFRSEKDGGAIYTMAAVGGEPRLVAKSGHNPRFSPNGAQIAYWAGGRLTGVASSHIFVVPASGGQPREIQTGSFLNRFPIWTEDGKQLLFSCGGQMLWCAVTPGSPDPAHRVQANLPRPNISAGIGPVPSGWWNGRVLFAAPGFGLRVVRLSTRSWEVIGSQVSITAGSALEMNPSVSNGGAIAFASLTHNANVWSLPVHAATGKPSGDLHPLTRNADRQMMPRLSRDGQRFVYVSPGVGVIVREILSGKEKVVVPDPLTFLGYPALSPDGRKIAFNTTGIDANKKRVTLIDLVDAEGGPYEQVCENCGLAPAWSSDGKKILWDIGSPRYVGLLDLEKKTSGPLIQARQHGAYKAVFSPDDRWIAFCVEYGADHAGIAVAPYREGARIEPSQWITITDGEEFESNPGWSSDGDRLYFASDRDGFRCIWTVGLDPATKRPLGQPVPVAHFHEARRSILNVGPIAATALSVGRDQLLFNLGEVTGNIWLGQPSGDQGGTQQK
jgi:Tol biopolymer transport system component